MARNASYIDFKRIQKNCKLYNLSPEVIENIYNSRLMTISSNDPFSFCYPIKYWDGILIRYNSQNITDSFDMIIELAGRLSGRMYISASDESLSNSLYSAGFSNYLTIYSVYKNNFYLPKKTGDFQIINYSEKYYKSIKALDEESLSFPKVSTSDDLTHFSQNNYSKVKLCIKDNELCGFCLYMLKPEAMYFYVIKIYVAMLKRRRGIGTMLLKSVIEDSKKYGYCPIFSDVFGDDPQPFLSYANFITWGESSLLIRP